LSIAVTSKLGIALGTPDGAEEVWAEQRIAVDNRITTQKLRIGMIASHHEVVARARRVACAGHFEKLGWIGPEREERLANLQSETLLQIVWRRKLVGDEQRLWWNPLLKNL
jgi:hypothetical protein